VGLLLREEEEEGRERKGEGKEEGRKGMGKEGREGGWCPT